MFPILVAAGDAIAAARDGRAVLDSLDRDRFARVLKDLCMPGVCGLEVLADSRRHSVVVFLVKPMVSLRQRDLVEWSLLPLALEGTSPTGDLA
jgi:CheY-like chemotaxis protein